MGGAAMGCPVCVPPCPGAHLRHLSALAAPSLVLLEGRSLLRLGGAVLMQVGCHELSCSRTIVTLMIYIYIYVFKF